ncbi:MAG: hypothetical protein EBX02_02565, partial [Betaproteobacteria bacterium]|nr:hypothetical protein [Betaproteobacteria bacterium]
VRGIGIINVAAIFGGRAIRTEKRLDLVVSLVEWEKIEEIERTGLDQQFSARFAIAQSVEQHAICRIGAGSQHQLVKAAADLSRMPGYLRHALFVGIELLKRDHRQVNIMLVKAKKARRIVQEHIGVEYKKPTGTEPWFFAAATCVFAGGHLLGRLGPEQIWLWDLQQLGCVQGGLLKGVADGAVCYRDLGCGLRHRFCIRCFFSRLLRSLFGNRFKINERGRLTGGRW